MRGRAVVACLWLAGALAAGPPELVSQVPRGGAAWSGTGETGAATLRGLPSLGANPALLGLDRTGGASLSFTSGTSFGMAPLGLGDLSRHQGSELSRETREAWLGRIAEAGGVSGHLDAHAGPLGIRAGRLAVQVATTAVGRASLDEDAAELLLFGNAGREGRARELKAEEAAATGAVFTTASVGGALPLELPRGRGRVSLGAAVHFTAGHALAMARDRGSSAAADPAELDFHLALVDPHGDAGRTLGRGAGVDLGVAWSGRRASLGLSLRNAVNGFRWNPESLQYRAGEARYRDNAAQSDFQRRSFTDAPDELRDEVAELRFRREVSLAAAREVTPHTTLLLEGRYREPGGLNPGPSRLAGVGTEHRVRSRLPLRGGVAWIPGGYQVGLGAGYEGSGSGVRLGLRLRSVDGRHDPGGTIGVDLPLPGF